MQVRDSYEPRGDGRRLVGLPADPEGANIRLLEPLPNDLRRAVLAATVRRSFGRDSVIYWEGDPGRSIHFIVSGHVAAQVSTPQGDRATVRVLGPGEHFGELALVSEEPRSATMVVLDAVETLTLDRSEFELLRRSTRIEDVFVAALAAEIRRLAAALTDALYLSATDNLWQRLADLHAAFSTGADPTELALTRANLAALAGVTRQTASKFLDDAEAIGIVGPGRRGFIVIRDGEALRRRVGRI